MSVTLTSAEKRARLSHLGVDRAKVRFGLNLTPAPERKWSALQTTRLYNNRSCRGAGRARRTAGDSKLASRALKAHYDAE
jgi:hypothetical protein